MLPSSFAVDPIHVVAERRRHVRNGAIAGLVLAVAFSGLQCAVISRGLDRLDETQHLLDESRAHVEALRFVPSAALARVLAGNFLDDGRFCFNVVGVDGREDIVACLKRGR